MKKSFKKITALVLAIVMVLTCNTFTFESKAVDTISSVTIVPILCVQSETYIEDTSYVNVLFGEGVMRKPSTYSYLFTDATCETPAEEYETLVVGNDYYTKIEIVKDPLGNKELPANAGDVEVLFDYTDIPEKYSPTVVNKEIQDGVLTVYLKYTCLHSIDVRFNVFNPVYDSLNTPSDFDLGELGSYEDKDFRVQSEVRYLDSYTYDGDLPDYDLTVKSVDWYTESDYSIEHKVATNAKLTENTYYLEVVADLGETSLTGDDLTEYNSYLNYCFSPENKRIYYNKGPRENSQIYGVSVYNRFNDDGTVTLRYELEKTDYSSINSVTFLTGNEKEVKVGLSGVALPTEEPIFFLVVKGSFNSVQNIFDSPVLEIVGSTDSIADSSTHLELTITVCDELSGAYEDNTTYTLYYECDSDDDSCHTEGIITFTTKFGGTTSHTTKKYTAKNVNTSAEKISGTGKKGSTRTITPKEGKKVASVVVTDKQGNKIDVTMNEDGTYSFIQPASAVNVEVNYKNREIKLTIGSTDAYVDEELNSLDVCPVIRNDRTMLPIRFVAENLGAKVGWDEKNPNIVTIKKDDIEIVIHLGSDKAYVNGKEYKLDSVAFAENDRTYLPVRFVSENLNAIVEWNEQNPMDVKIYER